MAERPAKVPGLPRDLLPEPETLNLRTKVVDLNAVPFNPTRRDDSRDHAKLLAATVFLVLKDAGGIIGATPHQADCLNRALQALDTAAGALVAYIDARNLRK